MGPVGEVEGEQKEDEHEEDNEDSEDYALHALDGEGTPGVQVRGVEEQVEEERKAQSLLDLVNSGINLFQAEPLLDQFE